MFQKVDESQFPPQIKGKDLKATVDCKFQDLSGILSSEYKYEYTVTLTSGIIPINKDGKVTPVLLFKDHARTPTTIAVLTTNAKQIEISTPIYFGTIPYVTSHFIDKNEDVTATLALISESSDCVTLGRTTIAPTTSEFTDKCAKILIANVEINLGTFRCNAGTVSPFSCRESTNQDLCDNKKECYWSSSYGGSCQDCNSVGIRTSCNLVPEQCKCSLFGNGCFLTKTSDSGTYMCTECIAPNRQAPNCENFAVKSDCISGACNKNNCKWENGACKHV